MRKTLRGLAVATVLTLAPMSAVAFSPATAQASETVAAVTPGTAPTSAPASQDAKAKPRRTIAIKDTPGPKARLRIAVRPDFANKFLVIEKGAPGGFTRIGRLKTNASGVAFRTFPGSRAGIRYRVTAVGGQVYATTAVKFVITRRVV